MVIQLLCFLIMFTHTNKLCVKVCVSFTTRCKSAYIAEREGFEPPVPLSTSVFKTGAIDHSAISPKKFESSGLFQTLYALRGSNPGPID